MLSDTQDVPPHPDYFEVSAFSSLAEREAAYARIKEETVSAEAALCSWKRRHNRLSLISRLPPELLSTVFHFIKSNFLRETLGWIQSMSHVCHHWRHVALGCPSLWADVTFQCPRWAEEMVTRSRAAPLNVYLGEHNYGIKKIPALKAALGQCDRIKNLSLSVNYPPLWGATFPELVELLDKPAPFLESCTIQFKQLHPKNRLPDIFTISSPHLVYLQLAKCGMNWQTLSSMVNIRILSLTDIPDTLRPSPTEIISGLSGMVRLEILTLTFPTVLCIDAKSPSLTIASLPLLEQLKINSSFPACVFLLDHIAYPNTSKLDITSPVPRDSTGSIESDVTGFRRLSSRIGQRLEPIECLSISHDHISIYTSHQNMAVDSYYQPVAMPQVFFHLENAWSREMTSHMIAGFLQPLPLLHLDRLSIADRCLQMDDYLLIFGDLPQLRTVGVIHDSNEFLYALSSGMSTFTTLDMQFRSLRRLTISEWILDNEPDKETSTTCLQLLIACLDARKTAGIGIKSLKLDHCRHVPDDGVEELAKVVDDVEWDEIGNYTESEEDSEEDSEDDASI